MPYDLGWREYLLHPGLAFRGHDESKESGNRGNFLELVKLSAEQNEKIKKVVLRNAHFHGCS
jgi:hypothetical protein